MPFLGLAPSAPSYCRGWGPALLLSADVSLGRGGATILGPHAVPLLPPSAPLSSVYWLVGGFPSPTHSCTSSPGTPLPLVATPGVSSPPDNSSTQGVSMPCGDSTPPCTPWRSTPGFSAIPQASQTPSSPLTPEGLLTTPLASRPSPPPPTP